MQAQNLYSKLMAWTVNGLENRTHEYCPKWFDIVELRSTKSKSIVNKFACEFSVNDISTTFHTRHWIWAYSGVLCNNWMWNTWMDCIFKHRWFIFFKSILQLQEEIFSDEFQLITKCDSEFANLTEMRFPWKNGETTKLTDNFLCFSLIQNQRKSHAS